MLIRTMKKMLPYIRESLCDRRYETAYFIWDTYFTLCMKLVRDMKHIQGSQLNCCQLNGYNF